jgi:quercetin 2,3-dioxygenase
MITLRRTGERHRVQRRGRKTWLSFYPLNHPGPFSHGFGALEVLDEDQLAPGASIPRRPDRDADIITYVRAGSLAYEDSAGQSGVIQAGEFRRTTAGRGERHTETNASRTDSAHVFQAWLRPSQTGLTPSREHKRFSAGDRRAGLCVVASPDARRGSLQIHVDAQLYSAMLASGTHIVHELAQGRSAWLHVVEGEITLGDVVLSTGDGAGFTGERVVSLTAREESEILVLDLAGDVQ